MVPQRPALGHGGRVARAGELQRGAKSDRHAQMRVAETDTTGDQPLQSDEA